MKEKRKIGLTTATSIGLILGAVTGVLLHYVIPVGSVRDSVVIGGIFYVMGNGFLRLVQVLMVPLVFCSLVCGSVAMGDTEKLGRTEVKTLGLYLMTIALAITTAILTANVVDPGKGLDMTSTETAGVAIGERADLTDTLLAIIPIDPLHALASGDMLSTILFALFIGMILAGLEESGETAEDFSSQFNDVMMQMTVTVMKLTPYDVFCFTARTFSGIGPDVFMPLLKYMVRVMIALVIQYLVVHMAVLRVLTGLSPGKLLEKFLPIMGSAFPIATSNTTISMSVDTSYREMGVAKRVSSFTIPLGATINMDDTAIMRGVAVVLTSQAFGIHLTMADYLTVILTATLTPIGTAGVPRVGLIVLSMVFASMGLPVGVITLIMGTNRILDMSRTAVNIVGDAAHTTIVASQDGAVDWEVLNDSEVGAEMEE